MKALDCDTDSVLYMQPNEGNGLVENGDFLGDITYELQPEQCIQEFLSGGPKNYAYVMVDPAKGCCKTVCKAKVITLIYAVSQLVIFDLIKNMVLNTDETATITVHTEKRIKRKREGWEFHSHRARR
jgi:hypothetical protein